MQESLVNINSKIEFCFKFIVFITHISSANNIIVPSLKCKIYCYASLNFHIKYILMWITKRAMVDLLKLFSLAFAGVYGQRLKVRIVLLCQLRRLTHRLFQRLTQLLIVHNYRSRKASNIDMWVLLLVLFKLIEMFIKRLI